MLTLNYSGHSPMPDSGALESAIERGTSVLQEIRSSSERYRDSLGWLHVDEWAGEEALCRMEALAEKIRREAQVFVLIGVGGSNNAARSVIEAIGKINGPEIIYAGNTLSPYSIAQIKKKLAGKDFYIDCIAKNFETLEPGVSFRVLRQELEKRYGATAHEHILATGTPGSYLEKLCSKHAYEFLAFPPNIGGRYTALCNVGLLPMAVAGVDVRALVRGAQEMQTELFSTDGRENIALRYACLRTLLYEKGYRIEMLSCFEPQMRWFYKWWIQLFSESEGKENKGLFPVASEFSEDLHSIGQFVQEGTPVLFETFLQITEPNAHLVMQPDAVEDHFDYLNGKDLWDVNQIAFAATRKAHSEKVPCLTLTMKRLDAFYFGQLFYFFAFACYLSGELSHINPFNQPGVEAYKGHMFEALGK